jgi:hypothetical protein
MILENLLRTIISHPVLHARWLNSLSYLEYRGMRKIARALKTTDIDRDILMHMQEEARHALLLKKMAIKIGGEEFSQYTETNMLAPLSFKKYFFDLDKLISQSLNESEGVASPKAIYHKTSLTIEFRAISLYRLYQSLLLEMQSEISIANLLVEEERHLQYFLAIDPFAYQDIEATCFLKLLHDLQSEVL